MEKGWEKIYITNQPHLVTIVQELLEENDIESVEINKGDSTFTFGDSEIFVREKDAILARTIILQHNL
ncbi:MAG TPA: DUF2007 domain-containing protein [Bacteroidia bacterium]|nr:DUF2007 domain-containing protein [Bacteroidia bacterium]